MASPGFMNKIRETAVMQAVNTKVRNKLVLAVIGTTLLAAFAVGGTFYLHIEERV